MHPLERFFWPRAVAVLGASPDPHRIRGLLLRHLRANGYEGRIVAVNPSYTDIDGLACHPSLAAAGGEIDVAVVAIPASGVAEAAEDCARAGVKFMIVISSGFAEEGGAASDMQARLLEVAHRTGLRIAGPNCEGYWNALGRISTTFSPTVEVKPNEIVPALVSERRIGVIAQSGGIGFSLFNRGKAAGLGFSYVMTTGNESDLTAADFLDYMVRDDRTHAVMLFCETIRDGARFTEAAEEARRRGKPIVAIKVGRSEAGSRASASHTAALSGSHAAYRAIFQRYGILEAEDPDEAVAIAGMVLTCKPPAGRRVGIITVSGGGGAWIADTLAAHGLSIPTLSADLQARIRTLIPSYATAQNPIDVTAQGGNTGPVVVRVLEMLEASTEVDSIVLVSSLASETRVMLDPERVRPLIEAAAKPVAVWSYTIPSAFGRRQAAACGLFVHTDLRACGIAMDRLAAYGEALARPPIPAAPIAHQANIPPGGGTLPEYRAKALLGLPNAHEHLAGSATDAGAAAEALGFPVALKIQSADIAHKTEAGGVRLNLRDRAEVEAAHAVMLDAVRRHKPDAVIDGVLVQRMAPNGFEFAVGMVNDPTFGPIMMVGFGGTTIELFGDVAHRPAPLTETDASAMIRALRSARLLEGFRGAAPVDIAPLARLVAHLSQTAIAHRGRIVEMELNPVILHADNSGLTVADALLTLRAGTK
ncbi:MAG: acetate--CoA ligase family protein [Acetobacteraceae bacterium]